MSTLVTLGLAYLALAAGCTDVAKLAGGIVAYRLDSTCLGDCAVHNWVNDGVEETDGECKKRVRCTLHPDEVVLGAAAPCDPHHGKPHCSVTFVGCDAASGRLVPDGASVCAWCRSFENLCPK